MKIAIVGAGFTPEEADRLRRAMATFKRNGDIDSSATNSSTAWSRTATSAISPSAASARSRGSGPTAFPESHAASFALLVYVSAWIKCFYPEVFACALLNSQPMGFYAPAQIVRDAREHGVEVLPGRHQSQRVGLHARGIQRTLSPPDWTGARAAPEGEGWLLMEKSGLGPPQARRTPLPLSRGQRAAIRPRAAGAAPRLAPDQGFRRSRCRAARRRAAARATATPRRCGDERARPGCARASR